jgi:4-amino-4-deoxy-L-arabinose transferase-like glycosyltransferase
MKKKNNYYILILSILIIFHLFNNVYFLQQDTIPFVWDNRYYHNYSVKNYNSIISGDFSGFINQYMNFDYAMLIFYPSFILYSSFGISEDVAAFQGTIFLTILIIATYLLGKELFNRNVGLLAAVIISFSPNILAFSKVPFEDIAFAAMFTLSVYFLLKLKNTKHIKYVWLFNLSFCLTLLSKVNSFFIFLAILILYVLFNINNMNLQQIDRKIYLHYFFSILIFMLIPLIFFVNNFSARLAELFYYNKMQTINFYIVFNSFSEFIKNIKFNFEYLFILIFFMLSFIFFLVLSKNKEKKLILSLVLGGNIFYFILFYFFPQNSSELFRYMFFLKPLYTIIISYYFVNLIFFCYNYISKHRRKKIKEKIFHIFITLIFLFFVPFTIIMTYTNLLEDPFILSANLGKFKVRYLDYDIKNLSDRMFLEKGNYSIFIFSPLCDIIDIYNSYNHYNYIDVNITYILINDENLEIRDSFIYISSKYDHFTNKNEFLIERLKEFDYVMIMPEFTIWNKNYNKFNRDIFEYLINNDFEEFEKINITEPNTILYIYKKNE